MSSLLALELLRQLSQYAPSRLVQLRFQALAHELLRRINQAASDRFQQAASPLRGSRSAA